MSNFAVCVEEHACFLMSQKPWRLGQALFNALQELAPMVANSVRGTDLDPFYDDKKCENFLTYLREIEERGKISRCNFCGRYLLVGQKCKAFEECE